MLSGPASQADTLIHRHLAGRPVPSYRILVPSGALSHGRWKATRGAGRRRSGCRKEGTLSRLELRILAGVDFSPESRRALDAARDLARFRGGTVTVAHVRPLSDVKAAVVEERGELLRQPAGHLAAAIAEHYTRRLARVGPGPHGERAILLRGAPGSALCREARRGYDLLVLGDRGRGRVAATLLGSTVQEALSRSPIPVLVVRSDERRKSLKRTGAPARAGGARGKSRRGG